MRGPVLEPTDVGYESARRIWNGCIDRRPSLIVRCLDTDDVQVAVRLSVEGGCAITVRGGGHNVAGRSLADGAILVDLGLMRQVNIDVDARTASAAGGCLLRDLDEATAPHGLACPTGVVSATGLGGLALGGGYGWLARRWGMTCDHIQAAEVVLADGSVVWATDDDEPDLLWALRGGGGSFGVITQLKLALHDVGQIHYRRFVYPLDEAEAAIAAYRDFAPQQPRDLHVVTGLGTAAAAPWIPEDLHGQPAFFVSAVWLGDLADGAAATAPLAAASRPATSVEWVIPFLELQTLSDASEPPGHRYYTKSCYLDDVSASTAAHLVAAMRSAPSPQSMLDLAFLGGAIDDAPVPSAFPHRGRRFMFTASGQWTSPAADDENVSWTRSAVEAVMPPSDVGVYLNYAEVETELTATAGGSHSAKLAAVKDRYDPDDVFRGHQAIRSLSRGSRSDHASD